MSLPLTIVLSARADASNKRLSLSKRLHNFKLYNALVSDRVYMTEHYYHYASVTNNTQSVVSKAPEAPKIIHRSKTVVNLAELIS